MPAIHSCNLGKGEDCPLDQCRTEEQYVPDSAKAKRAMTDIQPPQPGEFLLYETDDGRSRVECRFVADTLWLHQSGMAELFQTTKQNIAKHIKAIFAEGELDPDSVVNQWLTTAADKKNYRVAYYNLDVILAVGYRVRSARGTQFRRWATERLREYLVKGFTLDDERLKNPPVAGSGVPDRFDELLERIRDIRASERRMYLRVREIFAMAADYSPTLPETSRFFQVIQNKLHFSVTGKTAAELIAERADSSLPNMGLTTWKSGSVQKADVTVAKNYLKEREISELNRIVVMWLDFAEDQARRRKEVFLKDWAEKLDSFLTFNERDVLEDAGRVSREQAEAHAQVQYEQFAAKRRALLEAEGAEFQSRALEDAARALSKSKK